MVYTRNDPRRVFLSKITGNPAAFLSFAEKKLGIKLWEKQREIYFSTFEYPEVYVRTANAVGKTFVAGLIGVAFLLVYPENTQVIYIATKRAQAKRQAWSEFLNVYNKARAYLQSFDPPLDLPAPLSESVNLGPRWFATIWAGNDTDPEAFHGFHAPNLLFVIDEASGIGDSVREAVDRCVSGENNHVLALGNPVRRSGWFFMHQQKPAKGRKIIHISAMENPNIVTGKVVVPGLMTRDRLERLRNTYGETSPFWHISVLGEFPQAGDDSLIPWDAIEKAMERSLAPDTTRVSIGVDPARFGGSSTVIVVLAGSTVVKIIDTQKSDTYQVAGMIEEVCQEFDTRRVAIDASAPGWGAIDMLRKRGYRVLEFRSGNAPKDRVRFANLKAEAAWGLRNRFISGNISIPYHERLQWELGAWRYMYDAAKRIRVIDPPQSPDFADALLIAHWGQQIFADRGEIEAGGMPITAAGALTW